MATDPSARADYLLSRNTRVREPIVRVALHRKESQGLHPWLERGAPLGAPGQAG